jgi:hypothetical protein
MSYKKITIKTVIDDIDHNKVFLPALQRKFVWSKQQIQLLFDSLMRNYPIGTFLFWKLHRKIAEENYVFYEFLKEYDERSYNRRKTGGFTHDEITGVLDGQQRLSSMYIGLMGTHAERARYKRATNDAAYEKMSLYLNLLSLPYAFSDPGKIEILENRNFEFRFLPSETFRTQASRREIVENDGEPCGEREVPVYWFKVGDVPYGDEDLDTDQLIDKITKSCMTDPQRQSVQDQTRFIKKALSTLHSRICKDELVNYFETAKDDLEDILKIFIRVNSGGTVLNKTDLLFSTIVATWIDGREQIEELQKVINNKGDGFNFGNEFLMRCCLLLSDAPVRYKVNSFKAENVQKIQMEWPRIADAVRRTVDLLVEFGFNSSRLTSQNATIIIAYYIFKGGDLGNASKKDLRKYLIHALINRIYSGSQDQLLNNLRNALREEKKLETGATAYRLKHSTFSFEELLSITLPGRKSLAVYEGDFDSLLSSKKGSFSFFVLLLLYPNLRIQDNGFHQDHIHPFAHFKEDTLTQLGIATDAQAQWFEYRDTVPNLQLLEGKLNQTKNDAKLIDWVKRMNERDMEAFVRDNYFPDGVGLEFAQFMDFYQQRKEILRSKLKKLLAVSNERPAVRAEGWETDEELEEQDKESLG